MNAKIARVERLAWKDPLLVVFAMQVILARTLPRCLLNVMKGITQMKEMATAKSALQERALRTTTPFA